MNKTNTHKPGYKHTPLGWIPDDWEVKSVKDYGSVITGGTPPTSNQDLYGEEVMFITPGDLGLTKYISSTKRRLSDAGYQMSRAVPKGGVYFTCIGSTIGKVGIAKADATCNQQINAINCHDRASNEFLYYELSRIAPRIRLIAGEQAVPIINKSQFENYPVLFPPLPTQRNIATILSVWDEAIQKTQQLIEQLKQRNKGLMQQLFKPKAKWKDVKLSDIFERVTRKNTEVNTNVVTISAQRGFVRQGDFFNKQIASEILDNYFLVERGEFCYNKSYSNGYPWGATKRLNDFEKAVVTTLYICFRLRDKTKHSGSYFEYYFESGLLDVGLSKIAHEGGRAHGLLNVTPHDFFSLNISVPDITEQNRIYNVLSSANSELKLYQQHLANLQQQKKGLMQKLLSGEVRVKTNVNAQ
jgi:type I restriction enzyme S subunit